MRRILLSSALCLAPLAVQADDRSYLTALLEDNLSGAGRQVTITGFAGALSSRATMTKLTIADDQGIWLELDNVVLDWSRTALLSGEFIVNELSAAKITVARAPSTGDSDTPSPEASAPFQLPELPVSIDIGEIRADEISLGPDLLGQPITGTLTAKMHLADGEGTANLSLTRTDDGPAALIALNASYANASGQLVLDLDAREDAGGLVATALDLPGRPAAALSLKGQGALDDFAATFRLESDGDERLAGPITVKTGPEGETVFSADLTGNPAPLFLPDYAEFLGDRLAVKVDGTRWADGRLDLSALDLASRALNLTGRIGLAADGLPQLLDVTGSVALPGGEQVLLPISGDVQTRIARADLSLQFDAATGNSWTTDLTLRGLERSDLTLDSISLTGSGVIDRQSDGRVVSGALDLAATGIGALDAALLAALGQDITGQVQFDWLEQEAALNLRRIEIDGTDYGANGNLAIRGLGSSLSTTGRLAVQANDLSRFSALAGRPLGGAAQFSVTGEVAALTGAFDLDLDLTGQDLKTGIAEADRLLAGRSVITASVLRDQTGTVLRSFSANAATLALTAGGTLATEGSTLQGRIDWRNLADLGGSYGGAITADATFTGTPQNGDITLTGQGNNLRIGQAEVDRLIAGRSDVALNLALRDGVARLMGLTLTAPNLSAEVAETGNAGEMRVSGRLRDLALLVPEFPGAVSLAGTLRPQGTDYSADLRVQGPAGIDARLAGRVTGTPDLTIAGSATAAIANGFLDPVTLAGALAYDLRLQGGWTPDRLSGRATLSGGRVAIPARGLSLERVAVSTDFAGGSVRVTATADAPRGGRLRVAGPVGLTAPYNADLQIQLDGVQMRDPELYDTSFSGSLALRGGLLGNAMLSGLIALGETELRVPSTGFATAADLEAIRHINDSAAVRGTRVRAGVGQGGSGGDASGGSGLNWGVDLTIQAPQRVFIRGRGLDAELGGEIRLGGTLSNLVPSGGLQLIRGRLDILGRRLTLDEASLVLEGDFNPYLTIRASNAADEVTSIVTIEGPASTPEVTFSSDPELPQEEVLAWLLFGRGLDQISAFQAAQLANAVATLAGRGGEGIVGRLRKGFGFDDLDVTTDEDGSATVKAGKYISDNVYSEVGVNQAGEAQINLNLDLRPGLTAKARVESDGASGIGLFLEKDY